MTMGVLAAWAGAVSVVAQTPPAEPRAAAAPDSRSSDQLDEINNWVSIVKTANLPDELRVFNANQLIQKDWPEAIEAVMQLLTDSDTEHACVSVCRALARNGPPRAEFIDPLLRLLRDGRQPIQVEASAALAGYEDPVVAQRLTELIRDAEAPAPARAAAIATVAEFEDRLRAGGILIGLLEHGDAQINEPLYAALRQVSGLQTDDPEIWRQWWDEVKDLRLEDWQQREIKRLRSRMASMQAAYDQMGRRLQDALQQAYLRAGNGDKAKLLATFLTDDFELARKLGLDFVQRDIIDGVIPDEQVRTALRSRITDPSPAIRRGVLTILGNLRDQADAPRVIELLRSETDPATRLAAIVTLGELSNPQAGPVLIEVLQGSASSLADKLAAAKALGRLGSVGDGPPEDRGDAIVDALTQAYHDSSGPFPTLQRAVLQAMSQIGDRRFAAILLEHLQLDPADVRLYCIVGLRQMRDPQYLASILPYLTDADVAVRREVAVAIGRLGEGETQLGTLLSRLGPDGETDASVTKELWKSFGQIWDKLEGVVQFGWAKRINDNADRQIELLKRLEAALIAQTRFGVEVADVRTALAGCYDTAERHVEAARYWGLTAEVYNQAGDPRGRDAAVAQFRSLLRAAQYDQAVAGGRKLLSEDVETFKPRLGNVVLEQLAAEAAAKRPERIAALLAAVKKLPQLMMDDTFKSSLRRYDDGQTQTSSEEPLPASSSSQFTRSSIAIAGLPGVTPPRAQTG